MHLGFVCPAGFTIRIVVESGRVVLLTRDLLLYRAGTPQSRLLQNILAIYHLLPSKDKTVAVNYSLYLQLNLRFPALLA
jgi:hypothetical protein